MTGAVLAVQRTAVADPSAADYFNMGTPIAAIYNQFTPSELHNGGYSFGQIIGASPGTDFSAIKAAGATAMDFNVSAIPVSAVYSIYTPTELHNGGYLFGEIIGASPGTDYSAIKTAGATLTDFRNAAVAAPALAGVFSSLELVGGGFSGVTSIDWSLLDNTGINSPPGVFEQVAVAGNLAFDPGTILSLKFDGIGSAVDWTNVFWSSNHTWTILDVAGTTTGFGNLSLAQADWLDSLGHAFSASHPFGTFSLALDPLNGNSVQVVYTVPEPGTCVQFMIGGGLLLWRWRRRGPQSRVKTDRLTAT